MPSAAAPISSLCSAMRFLSRQVSWSTGSMPASSRRLGCGKRGHMGAGAGAVGDIDGVGQAFEAGRLAQEFLPVERHRRRDLRRHDEAAVRPILAKSVLECRGEGATAGLVVHYLLSFGRPRFAAAAAANWHRARRANSTYII